MQTYPCVRELVYCSQPIGSCRLTGSVSDIYTLCLACVALQLELPCHQYCMFAGICNIDVTLP